MKAITVHGIDDTLACLITERAKRESLSQNKTVKKLLAEALGMYGSKKRHDFSDFCGVWGKEEFDEFVGNIKQFEQVDELEWN